MARHGWRALSCGADKGAALVLSVFSESGTSGFVISWQKMILYDQMDFLYERDKLDSVIPGVTAMYEQLRDSPYGGMYTSLGRYYNHTLFARDSGMSAKFVSDFDHETVWQTIVTLAGYQGVTTDRRTQEQLGRIHHELRDFAAWDGRWYDRINLELAGIVWGARNHQLLTYFASDTTATYIRLVHKYARRIDASILDRLVPTRDGRVVALRGLVVSAANWLADQVDERGVFWTRRTNRLSLPYQTFADSTTAYAWSSGQAADSSRPHSFIEVQFFALDALEDACALMPEHTSAYRWRQTIERMERAVFSDFWNEAEQTFSPGLFEYDGAIRQLDTPMVTAAWGLNTTLWKRLPKAERHQKLEMIIERIFREDFLTDIGLRTKSSRANEPLGTTIDYHGSRTVWPMFNFMVIEGLRRHGLYRLARQLEYRICNGINAIGSFPEFMMVDHDGTLYTPDRHAKLSRSGQMIPEQNIAFTVVPALTLAYRTIYKRSMPATSGWQHEFEEKMLAKIPLVELLGPADALVHLAPVPLKIRRTGAGIRSALHIVPVMMKKTS